MQTTKSAGKKTRKQKYHCASSLSILTAALVFEIAALALFLPERVPVTDSAPVNPASLIEVPFAASIEKNRRDMLPPDPPVNAVVVAGKEGASETAFDARASGIVTNPDIIQAEEAPESKPLEQDLAAQPPIVQEGEDHNHPPPAHGEKLPENSRIQPLIGSRRVGFSLKFGDFDTNLALITLSRLPGEPIDFSVAESKEGSDFVLEPGGGLALANANNRWTWKTPREAGFYGVDIREKNSGEIMRVRVAVQVPYDGSEYVGGYRIGQYKAPLRGSPRYNKPKGFIQVNEKDLDTWVSPHLQLKQFICKQKSSFPKYMLLDPLLLVKLELVIDSLERQGIPANKLHVTSGFRTPFYNKAIGNKTSSSRHCYGDAADLFIDVDGDGRMDDLDTDGDLTDDDGALLHATAHTVESENEHLMGGLGFYGMAQFRNPTIHVDTRGYQARWPSNWQSRLKTGKSLMVHNLSGESDVADTGGG